MSSKLDGIDGVDGVAPLIADPHHANITTMHRALIWKDRHLCPCEPPYLPGPAKSLKHLNQCGLQDILDLQFDSN